MTNKAKYNGYHDVEASALTESSVAVTDEQAALAGRAIAGHRTVADASELSELLAMLGLDAKQARDYGRRAPSAGLRIQGHKTKRKARRK